jgi:hypothetical protein
LMKKAEKKAEKEADAYICDEGELLKEFLM